ncbi:MAG: hypothetical protein U0R19_10375 [Bryobacteraceae bacterium]
MKQSAMILGLLLLAMPVGAQKGRPAEMLLESARQKATVEGDVKGALRAYEDVVKRHAGDRAAVAKALVGMAECHQKLGDSEALRLYQRVAREFGDQKEAAEQARARMAGLRPRSGPAMATNRKVFTVPPGGDLYGTVSPDGRYAPYVNWEKKGNLFLRDLETGVDRQITDQATDEVGTPHKEEQYAEEYAFSRDGKQIVYSWYRGDTDRYELRVASLQGTGVPAYRRLFDKEGVDWIGPHDWSPDGKWIAVSVMQKDHVSQMGLVSAADGSLRVLKTVDWRRPNGMFFSPDGRHLAYDLHASETKLDRDVFVLELESGREIPVMVHPSNDVVAGWTPDGKRLLFSSDRRGSTDLWAVAFPGGSTAELIHRDFASVEQMSVSGSGVLYYSSSQPPGSDLQVGSFDFERGVMVKTPVQAAQSYVGRNRAPIWSPDGKQLAWQSRRGGSGTRYYVLGVKELESGQEREILPRPNFDRLWSFLWEPDGRYFLVSGKDLKGRTGIFRINAATGESGLLFEHKQFGLSVSQSPDGRYLYYGVRNPPGENHVVIYRRDRASGEEKVLFEGKDLMPFAAVSADGRHVGTVATSRKNAVAVLVAPSGGGAPRELLRVSEPQRAVLLAFTPDSQAAIVRKVLAPGSVEIWRYPLDGGAPKKLEGGVEVPQALFSVHPDGRQVAFPVNLPASPFEIWALENFMPGKGGGN